MIQVLTAVLAAVLTTGVTIGAGGGIGVRSRYLWRGCALSSGPVLQPDVWVSLGDVSAGIWANGDLGRAVGEPVCNEVDVSLDWCRALGPLRIRPSVGAYLFPRQQRGSNTAEVALEVAVPPGPGWLAFSTNHNLDVLDTPGAYYGEAGLETSWSLPRALQLGARASLGWASARYNRACFDTAHAGLNAAYASGSVGWAPRSWLLLAIEVSASTLIDRALRAQVTEPALTAVGLSLDAEF